MAYSNWDIIFSGSSWGWVHLLFVMYLKKEICKWVQLLQQTKVNRMIYKTCIHRRDNWFSSVHFSKGWKIWTVSHLQSKTNSECLSEAQKVEVKVLHCLHGAAASFVETKGALPDFVNRWHSLPWASHLSSYSWLHPFNHIPFSAVSSVYVQWNAIVLHLVV